jgi:hypothetical protein
MFESTTSFRFSRQMVFITLTTLVACAFDVASPTYLMGQEDSQPYMVYVDQEGVIARCGPGGDYYRTDPLRHGQALEVYVETEDGWLGIRPPENSFCWLPADAIKLSPGQDFGIVVEENSLAWIGTHLGKANKYLWQVQLSKGEEVAILGRAQREGPDGQPKLWFRIVPPAGEFRWVHRDQVVENPEMLIRDKPKPNSQLALGQPTLAPEPESFVDAESRTAENFDRDIQRLATRTRSRDDLRDDADFQDPQYDREPPLPTPKVSLAQGSSQSLNPVRPFEMSVIGSGVDPNINAIAEANNEEVVRAYEAPLVAFTSRPTMRSIGEPDASPGLEQPELVDAFEGRGASRRSTAPTQQPLSQMTQLANQHRASQQLLVDQSRVAIPAAVVPVSNTIASSRSNDRSVDALQLELSRLMSRSAPAVDVEPVLAAATEQSRTGKTESDRQRASMIVERAQQYRQVANRRDRESFTAPSSLPPLTSYPEPILSGIVPRVPTSEDSPAEMVGFLVQVFSSRPDSPPFALTDKQGRTIFYVSPAPGVNLRRNLNQYVTVRGSAGYATGLDTPHVIASGVVRTLER